MTIQQMINSTKETLIKTMQEATRQTAGNNPHDILKACVLVTETQRELHDKYGMTWSELEGIQIETLQQMA